MMDKRGVQSKPSTRNTAEYWQDINDTIFKYKYILYSDVSALTPPLYTYNYDIIYDDLSSNSNIIIMLRYILCYIMGNKELN